jgi:hypothetical protein
MQKIRRRARRAEKMNKDQKKNIREGIMVWGEQAIEKEYMPVIMVCLKRPDNIMVCRADDQIGSAELKDLLTRIILNL